MTRKVIASMSLDTLSPTLFEGLDVLPQIYPYDTARAGLDDPIQSHMAADQSSKSIVIVRERVLHLLAYRRPTRVTGNEINDRYAALANLNGWERVHFDSPRKRAHELSVTGHLLEEKEIDGKPLRAQVYTITDKGLDALR